jgi:hypothetical protein
VRYQSIHGLNYPQFLRITLGVKFKQFCTLIQALDKATNRLNSKFIIICVSAFVTLVMVFFLAIFLYVPSLDEIQQRRADKKALDQYALQMRVEDGETLVRIMTKDCYSFQPKSVKAKDKTYDWCRIDPKKY